MAHSEIEQAVVAHPVLCSLADPMYSARDKQ
eukprot:COSAG01_NODE_43386_length_430_cov_0.960725_1_plen_30_part_10